MKPALFLCALSFILGSAGCHAPGNSPDNALSGWPVVSERFSEEPLRNVAILPISAVDTVTAENQSALRKSLYNKFLEKGYAPLAPGFTDRRLKERNLTDTPIRTQYTWNAGPFKGSFSQCCDALVFVSVERFQAIEKEGMKKIEVWGKLAIYDTLTMALLYEHYVQRTVTGKTEDRGAGATGNVPLEALSGYLLEPLPAKRTASP